MENCHAILPARIASAQFLENSIFIKDNKAKEFICLNMCVILCGERMRVCLHVSERVLG